MIYKNAELHNVADLVYLDDGVTWKRFPASVCDTLELDTEHKLCTNLQEWR